MTRRDFGFMVPPFVVPCFRRLKFRFKFRTFRFRRSGLSRRTVTVPPFWGRRLVLSLRKWFNVLKLTDRRVTVCIRCRGPAWWTVIWRRRVTVLWVVWWSLTWGGGVWCQKPRFR